MNSIMRRTVRGAATGLGALALIAGASACGAISDLAGGDDDPSAEQPAEDEGGVEEGSGESEGEGATSEDGDAEGSDTESEDADAEESEGDAAAGGNADAEPLSEEDLTAAGDRFYAFFEAIGAQDPEGACSLVIDYDTGEPAEGDGLQTCVDSFDEAFGGDFDPSVVEAIDRSMIDAGDSGDGRASITMMGESAEMYMKKAGDGQWYIEADAPF